MEVGSNRWGRARKGAVPRLTMPDEVPGDVKWQWMTGGCDDTFELVWRGPVDVACVGELRRASASDRLECSHV